MEQFPPLKIRTAAQARATESRIEELLAKPRLSDAEAAYADLLSDLLADWEDATVEIPDVRGVELLRCLLEDRGRRQKDLVGVFAAESIASEVLAGRRELSRKHIEGLARFFKVSPAAFFPGTVLTATGTYDRVRRRTIGEVKRVNLHTRRLSANVRGREKPGV